MIVCYNITKQQLIDPSLAGAVSLLCAQSLQLKPEDYAAAARSGMNGLAMGVESPSESVRQDMVKGFSNSDLDYTLEQFCKQHQLLLPNDCWLSHRNTAAL